MGCVKVKVEMKEIERHFPCWDLASTSEATRQDQATSRNFLAVYRDS